MSILSNKPATLQKLIAAYLNYL